MRRITGPDGRFIKRLTEKRFWNLSATVVTDSLHLISKSTPLLFPLSSHHHISGGRGGEKSKGSSLIQELVPMGKDYLTERTIKRAGEKQTFL